MSLFKEKVIKDYILLLLCLFVQYVYCCLAGCENKKSRRKGFGFSAGLYVFCALGQAHLRVYLISRLSCRCSSS